MNVSDSSPCDAEPPGCGGVPCDCGDDGGDVDEDGLTNGADPDDDGDGLLDEVDPDPCGVATGGSGFSTGTGPTTTAGTGCTMAGGLYFCECGDPAGDVDGDGVANPSDTDTDGDAQVNGDDPWPCDPTLP